MLPPKHAENTNPWKYANTFGYEFESDIKRPKVKMLSNTVIARMPLIPRSYDQSVRTDLHSSGYKLTSNSIGEFGSTDLKSFTKLGR